MASTPPAENHHEPQKKESRRIFFALPLHAELRGAVATLSESLRKAAQFTPARITWVKPDNYHLTLHFLARVPEASVQRLIAELPAFASRHSAFKLQFQGLGYFPNQRAPKVLWVGVRTPPAELNRIVDGLAEVIKSVGIELVHDNFHPHITLARFKVLKGTGIFVKQASIHRSKFIGSDEIDRIVLMESELGPEGSTYTVIGEGRLA